ncbi:MAG: hypothetical protein GQ547_10150, partial [Methylophaga sp.]|nr:hypothetical protein [Methylophaga sp.]
LDTVTGGAATGEGSVGTGTVVSDDPVPSFIIDDVTVDEGDGTITFTVNKVGLTSLASSVNYVVSQDTALTPDDYTAGTSALSGTLNFLAGQAEQTITLNITDDQVFELEETFNVDLSGAVNATISDAQGIGTILDNDIETFPTGLAYTVAGSKTVDGEQLYAIDLETGETTRVGEVMVNGVSLGPNSTSGLSLSPDDGFLYGFASKEPNEWLVKINPATAETEIIDEVTDFSKTSAATFDAAGNFYYADGDLIYSYDFGTNTPTLIADAPNSAKADAIAVTPDGTTMYIAVGDDLWVVPVSLGDPIEVPVLIDQIVETHDNLSTTAYTIDGLSFDDIGVLWGLDGAGIIVRIDPSDASAEKVSTISNSEVTGAGADSLAISIVDPGTYVVISDATNVDGTQDRAINHTQYFDNDGSGENVILTNAEVYFIDVPDQVDMSIDDSGAVTVSQTSDVENVFIQTDTDGDITVNDFISVDVQTRGEDTSTIVINDAERGDIDSGEGNDNITINAAATTVGAPGPTETFIINTDGGDDTITLSDVLDSNYIINTGEEMNGLFSATDIDTVIIDGSVNLGTGPLSLQNVEVLDITGGGNNNTLTLTAADVLDVTDETNTLIIKGDNLDALVSSDAWVSSGTQEGVDGITYNAYTSGLAIVLVEEINVTNIE